MDRPRIGIPTHLDTRGRIRAGRDYHYIDRRYADAIDRAGGLAIHLPIQSDIEALVEGIDGLLLPGGDDFPSERPLPPGVELDLVPDVQRRFDEALLEVASHRARPILGICYGMQLLALSGGGILEPHLPSAPADTLEHRLPADGRHRIDIVPGSALARILECETAQVNSLHHQAIVVPGASDRVVARSEDGVIEAIESRPGEGIRTGWRIGVQWHPEKLEGRESERLFGEFVSACGRRVSLENPAI